MKRDLQGRPGRRPPGRPEQPRRGVHQALVKRKYRLLFSSARQRRTPGPKGPFPDLIQAIVETKRRNPRYDCPRIALLLSQEFGVEIDKDVVRAVCSPSTFGPSRATGTLVADVLRARP